MPTTRAAAWVGLMGVWAACTPSPEPRPPNPAAPAPSASASLAGDAATGWDEKNWGRFHSKRFSLWLSLPDGKAWRIDDHRTSWLVASHAPSSSSLSVRVFLESEATNAARCEARARQNDPRLPDEGQGRVLSRELSGALPGWDTRSLATSVTLNKPHEPLDLEGHLAVFSASNRKCMVIHYATRAVGAGADGVLGARIADAEELVRKIEPVNELEGPGQERPSFAR